MRCIALIEVDIQENGIDFLLETNISAAYQEVGIWGWNHS